MKKSAAIAIMMVFMNIFSLQAQGSDIQIGDINELLKSNIGKELWILTDMTPTEGGSPFCFYCELSSVNGTILKAYGKPNMGYPYNADYTIYFDIRHIIGISIPQK